MSERYKQALSELDPKQRTCFLYLERLIKETKLETLRNIPEVHTVDLSSTEKRLDSLQKQINGLKNIKKELIEYRKKFQDEDWKKVTIEKKLFNLFNALGESLENISKGISDQEARKNILNTSQELRMVLGRFVEKVIEEDVERDNDTKHEERK